MRITGNEFGSPLLITCTPATLPCTACVAVNTGCFASSLPDIEATAPVTSFFLAVPTMFAASVKDLFDFYKDGTGLNQDEILLLIVGNVVAFFVAMLAIRSFVAYLTKHGFKVFGYYRIVVGLIILILYGMGYELTL